MKEMQFLVIKCLSSTKLKANLYFKVHYHVF